MADVFFSGYGWWYYKHRRNSAIYSISRGSSTVSILFPLCEDSKLCTGKPERTAGNFYLEREDKDTYIHTKTTTHVKKLYPFPDNPGHTFSKLTQHLEIGARGIRPEDCFFIIDNDQTPEFIFFNNNKQETVIKQDSRENKRTEKGQKKHKLRWLIWRVYRYLVNNEKISSAQAVWDEIRFRHEKHDEDEIIQEVTAEVILWDSPDSNEPTFKRKSLGSTISKLKKKPPF